MRTKKFRKFLLWYRINFNVVPPFTVLLHPSFVIWAKQKNVDLPRLVPKLLGGESVLMVTTCSVKQLGKDAGEFPVHDCKHEELDEGCVHSIAAVSPGKFIVACQDEETRRGIAKIPGIPLIYLSNNVLMLEPPSQANQKSVQAREEDQLKVEPEISKQAATAKKLLRTDSKKAQVTARYSAALEYVQKKNKKAKGPNPLSVKKKKKKTTTTTTTTKKASR